MHAEFAARGFHGGVHLSGGHPESLGDDLEVVDQALHGLTHDPGDVGGGVAQPVGAQFQISRPGQFLVLDHHRPRADVLQTLQALGDDLQRLVHLADPDQIAAVAVGGVGGDDVEIVSLITTIRLGLAQVVGQAGGPQHRSGDPQCHAAGQVQVPDALGAGFPDVALGEQCREFPKPAGQDLQQLGHPLRSVVGQVGGQPAGADVGVVHPQAGDRLEQGQDEFAFPEAEEHRRHRTEFHAAGGQRHQVRGDPVELHEHHPDHRGARRNVVGDAQEAFHPQAVRGLVEERREIVHPRDEGDALGPVPVLQVLLDPGVQKADAATGFDHRLALDLQDQPQHPVGGRVLRSHVDHDALAGHAVFRGGDDLIPVLSAENDDGIRLERSGAHQR